jgi:hypothetical protein
MTLWLPALFHYENAPTIACEGNAQAGKGYDYDL